MRILLFGKGGQLGHELLRALAPLGELIALDRHMPGGDLSQPEAVAAAVRRLRPTVIVNAAAYTAVDQAEREPALARRINSECVATLAREAEAIGAWLVHYSTDYVFDGQGDCPWREEDPTAPLNVYGQTKLAGEQAAARCTRHLIFRVSWLYAAHGRNFITTMLRLGREREQLAVVNDQFGAPTHAALVADCTAHALRLAWQQPELAGLYHLAAAGTTSWYEVAHLLFDAQRTAGHPLTLGALHPIPSGEYPCPARRPHNSRLNTEKFAHTFGLTLPHWQSELERVLAGMLATSPP